MLDFQRKKRLRKILYSPIVLFLLAILLALLIRGVFGVYSKEKLSSINLDREQKELEKLHEREQRLTTSLDYLKTEQGVEDEIRTKFRAVKEGEKVAVIVDDQASTGQTVSTTTRGFWYNLFHW